jgi:hypothetical protein
MGDRAPIGETSVSSPGDEHLNEQDITATGRQRFDRPSPRVEG